MSVLFSSEVAALLPSEVRDRLRVGAKAAPIWRCALCGVWADARVEDASVLVADADEDQPKVARVHEACSPPRRLTATEFAALPHPRGQAPPTHVWLAGTRQRAVVVVQLAINEVTVSGSPDGPVVRDESLHALEQQGWERLRSLDAVSGLPEPEGWRVGLRDGRLAVIDDGRGGWLAFTPGVGPVAEAEWEQTAARCGRVVVLVLPPGTVTIPTYGESTTRQIARVVADPTLMDPVLERRAFHKALVTGDVLGAQLPLGRR